MREAKSGDRVDARHWKSLPVVGIALRVAIFLGPIATGVVTSWELSKALPDPSGVVGVIAWWAVVSAATVAMIVLAERLAHRLLPLATLFSLSLVFPDNAPSRFKVARQVGRPADLRRRLEEAQADGALDEATRMQTVLELVTALAVHDKQTRGHSERVRVYTDMIAAELNLSAGDRGRLRWASLLHDVGKLNVSHSILTKPGKPTDAEWEQLRRHPDEGARLASAILPWLGRWGAAVAHHHERWDGTGYPRGLKGDEISFGGRIVAVADAFEVMTAVRPYKRAMSPTAARQELVRCSGTHFDAVVVRAFLNVSLGRLWRAMGPGALLAQLPLIAPLVRVLYGLGERAGPAVASATTVTTLATGGIVAPTAPFTAARPPTSLSDVGHPGQSVPGGSSATPGASGSPAAGPGSGPSGAPTPHAAPTQTPAGDATPAPTPGPGDGGVTPTPTPTPPPTPPTPPPDGPPTVIIGTLASILEGGTLSASGSVTDPDGGTWTATVDYGDGTGTQPLSLIGTSFHLSHAYGNPCVCVVTVAVTDADGATGRATTRLEVLNSPVSARLAATSSSLGLLQPYSNRGTIADADGGAEAFAGTVNYGDGSVQALTISNGQFSLSHLYLLPGTYTVTVTVRETDDGTQAVATATVSAL